MDIEAGCPGLIKLYITQCMYYKLQKHFQNHYVMLVGMASEISKNYTQCYTSVWMTQDTTESRVPRLNVHTNQILVHTFSHGTLDFVVYSEQSTHLNV